MEEIDITEDLTKCEECGKLFKNIGVHMRHKHKKENSSSAPSSPSKGCTPPTRVKFTSTRSPSLRVVIRPTRQGFINTQAGSMSTVFEGKTVQFIRGELVTEDPEVITYLDNTYNDRRYPVVNVTKLGEKSARELYTSGRSAPLTRTRRKSMNWMSIVPMPGLNVNSKKPTGR